MGLIVESGREALTKTGLLHLRSTEKQNLPNSFHID